MSYGVDREWISGLRSIISRYGALRAERPGAEHHQAHDFTKLVVDTLRHWGINARTTVRRTESQHKTDIVFSVGDTRYALDATWLPHPLPADADILRTARAGRSSGGTRRIVLSMSGYVTVHKQRRSGALLLSRSHFEAMLSGLIQPEHLLHALTQHLARHGEVDVPLTDLLMHQPISLPTFTSLPTATTPWKVIATTDPKITARTVLLGDTEWPAPVAAGLGRDHPRTLLVTTPEGIVEVAIESATTRWALPLRGCQGTPVLESDGSLLTACNYAVIRWHNSGLDIVGGGFTGNSTLLTGLIDPAWVFDTIGSPPASLLTLTSLGHRLGDQQQHDIDIPFRAWNAAWLGNRTFFLTGDNRSAVVDLDALPPVNPKSWIASPQSGPRSILVRSPTTVITAAGEPDIRGSIYRTNVTDGAHRRLVRLAVNSVQGLTAVNDHEAYLLADVRGNNTRPLPILIHLTGLGPFTAVHR